MKAAEAVSALHGLVLVMVITMEGTQRHPCMSENVLC
jgi:hypothetical protein